VFYDLVRLYYVNAKSAHGNRFFDAYQSSFSFQQLKVFRAIWELSHSSVNPFA
jgi:hypothetical protein